MPALVVMGVSGCGKTQVSEAIAARTGACLIEGDQFHPPANVAKMRAGVALDDQDRAGWLAHLGNLLAAAVAKGQRPVLSCSALKRKYRERLRAAVPDLGFVFLQLAPDEARRRVAGRHGHYMPASLVDSQFADLQPPGGESGVLTLDARRPVLELAEQAVFWWNRCPAKAPPVK